MERSSVQILAYSRDLVARGWCREAEARDAEGVPVDPWQPEARCWSLLGAIVAAAADVAAEPDERSLRPLRQAMGALAEVIDEPLLSVWNDAPGRTQAEVVETLATAERLCADRDAPTRGVR